MADGRCDADRDHLRHRTSDIPHLTAFRRFDGGHDDRGDFVAFAHQVGQLGGRDDAGFDKEFEPISGLVGFFFDDGELVDEIGSRFPPARGFFLSRLGLSKRS